MQIPDPTSITIIKIFQHIMKEQEANFVREIKAKKSEKYKQLQEEPHNNAPQQNYVDQWFNDNKIIDAIEK